MFKSEEEEWSEDKTEGERDKKKRGRETERKTRRQSREDARRYNSSIRGNKLRERKIRKTEGCTDAGKMREAWKIYTDMSCTEREKKKKVRDRHQRQRQILGR